VGVDPFAGFPRCAIPVRATGGGELAVGEMEERGSYPDFASPLWRPVHTGSLEFDLDNMRTDGGPFVPSILVMAVLVAILLAVLVRRGKLVPVSAAAWALASALAPVGVGLLGTRHGLSSIEELVANPSFCLDRASIVAIALPDAAKPFHLGALCSIVLIAVATAVAARLLWNASARGWLALVVPAQLSMRVAIEVLALDERRQAIVRLPPHARDLVESARLPVLSAVPRRMGDLPDAPILQVSADGVATYDDTHGRQAPIPLPVLGEYGEATGGTFPLLAIDAAAPWRSVAPIVRDLAFKRYPLVAVVHDPTGRPTPLRLPPFGSLDPHHEGTEHEELLEIDASGASVGGAAGVLREPCDQVGSGPTVPRIAGRIDFVRAWNCGRRADLGWDVDLWISPDTRFGDVVSALEAAWGKDVLFADDEVRAWFLAWREASARWPAREPGDLDRHPWPPFASCIGRRLTRPRPTLPSPG
jgi:hypothetical protein